MLFCGENEVWCPHEIAAERPTSVSGGKCINANSVTTCGGCNTGPFGLGVDCGDIEDVDQVRCVMGRCVVESCLSGEPSSDGSQCVGSKK
ncbi:hypothetical protein BD324DRAFT_655590 [Kockovaella imperatae]|uniref:Protein CPL1-like domain-containing protein n=1 Tax=Kockovaella imperatae TaxID=4999 RepID=A0A1Y1UL05_9TREE|nr:hypothetical protein BD324DRAFT_655590 [Kockovaella imperatae]ORX38156.1 hypothetical protein BD324DRAFT_655590 [Kockovaella imperatae]